MSNWKRSVGLIALLGGACMVACSASGGDDTGESEGAATQAQIDRLLDVNDVSILFPIKDKAPYPQIRVSGVADEGADTAPPERQLWKKTHFDQVIAQAKKFQIATGEAKGDDFFGLRGLWHITALRFDPCAPGFSDAALQASQGKCIIQLRLIAQPFLSSGRDVDFAAHLVFNLGAVPKADLAKNPVVIGATKLLGDIKAASAKAGGKTAGLPLGVHPGLAAEAPKGGGDVANLVKTLIRTFTEKGQRAVAFMGLRNGGPEPWTFFAGKVDGDGINGNFVVQPGPVHGDTSQSLDFISGKGPVRPAGSPDASTTPLFKFFSSKDVPANARKLAFAVEDVRSAHFFNTDCVSCHTSSGRTHELSLGDGEEISRKFPIPANVTGYVAKGAAQDSVWNVRNFGYFEGKPTVSGRTVNETADVVEWMNRNVVSSGANLAGPGLDCSGVDAKVWKCFRDGKSDCFKIAGAECRPAPKPTPDVVEPPPVPAPSPDGENEPCSVAKASDPATVKTASDAARKVVVATIGGNNSECLTRVMGGSFKTEGLEIDCGGAVGPTGTCTITVPDGAGDVDIARVEGDEAARFKKFFRPEAGSFFQTRGPDAAGVQIFCGAEKCEIAVAASRGALPARAGAKRINPEK